MSVPQKDPGAHKNLPFPSKITEKMSGICEAGIEENQCFGIVYWDMDWEAQEKQGRLLRVVVKQECWLL